MKLGKKILSIFNLGKKTVREISAETNIPKSTVHYHKQKLKERTSDAKTDFWESESGRNLVIRLVIATIYMFALKSGNGAGNLNEFFELLELDKHAGISESTILKIIKRVEALILEYKEAVEKDIKTKVEEIKVILGVDETWFDNMYLVCQELSSGYLFFETASEQRDADSWEAHIKKTLFTTTES